MEADNINYRKVCGVLDIFDEILSKNFSKGILTYVCHCSESLLNNAENIKNTPMKDLDRLIYTLLDKLNDLMELNDENVLKNLKKFRENYPRNIEGQRNYIENQPIILGGNSIDSNRNFIRSYSKNEIPVQNFETEVPTNAIERKYNQSAESRFVEDVKAKLKSELSVRNTDTSPKRGNFISQNFKTDIRNERPSNIERKYNQSAETGFIIDDLNSKLKSGHLAGNTDASPISGNFILKYLENDKVEIVAKIEDQRPESVNSNHSSSSSALTNKNYMRNIVNRLKTKLCEASSLIQSLEFDKTSSTSRIHDLEHRHAQMCDDYDGLKTTIKSLLHHIRNSQEVIGGLLTRNAEDRHGLVLSSDQCQNCVKKIEEMSNSLKNLLIEISNLPNFSNQNDGNVRPPGHLLNNGGF